MISYVPSLLARATFAAATLAISSQVFSQTQPMVPVGVCIQDSSGPSACASVGGSMKWHPGHYVRAFTIGTAKTTSERFAAYDAIRNNPYFKGGVINVTWSAIEPRKDVYDFSVIDTDLNYLKAMGKRLIIEVWTSQYGGSGPSTEYFPQWMINEGGAANDINGACCSVQLQQAYWMDRYIKLIQKLGERYNAEPFVEQLQTNETSTTEASQYKRLIRPMALAWPNTPTILYMNFVGSTELARELVALAAQNGVGIGGPDILPPKPLSPYGEDHGSLVSRGAGIAVVAGFSGDYGTTDYRDVIPLSYQYQGLNRITPASLIDYALNTMRMTHITWTKADSEIYPGDPASMLWSTGVVPTVNSVNGRTNTKCPSIYAGRCNSN